MSRPDLVIFDCDGVLIDSEIIACRAVVDCLGELGIRETIDDVITRYVGVSAKTMFADFDARYGARIPADFHDRLRERTAQGFDAGLKPMPGVAAAIEALDCPICVASSSAPERLARTLSLTGLLRYFDPHVFSATQVKRGKPAPDLFLFAAERMGVAPERCVVIEDSVLGVQGARAAGMRVIGFAGGSHCGADHADKLRAAGAGAVHAEMRTLFS